MSELKQLTHVFDKLGVKYEVTTEKSVFDVPTEEFDAPPGLKTAVKVELAAFCFDDEDRFAGTEDWETCSWTPRTAVEG